MVRRIAVAYDDSPEAGRAFQAALYLAKALGTELRTITVIEELPAYTGYVAGADASVLRMLQQDRTRFYEELQANVKRLASLEGAAVISELIDGGTVEAIAGFVRAHKIDLLVIGLHHRSLHISRIWSTVYSLAQDVPCNILGVH